MAYLYANDGFTVSTQPKILNQEFDVLIGLFVRVGLRMNTRSTVRMACHPCHMLGRMLVVENERLTTGTGTTYWELQRMQVKFPECGVDVAARSLLTHH